MRRAALAVGVILACAGARPAAQTHDIPTILEGLAERTRQYYDRFVSIICTETVHQQDLRRNLSPTGRPRVTVYELSVARDPDSSGERAFRVGRTLQMVNGRPARPNHRPECTDPKTGSPEPMAFLLAENQSRYRFMPAPGAQGGPAGAQAIDFEEAPPSRVTVTWNGPCFEADGGGQHGRVWFDPRTFDVQQVEVRLARPFRVNVPPALGSMQPTIRVERSEATIRFSRVTFQEPDEVILLPHSIETLHVLQGIPSLRIRQTLDNYRRFLTKAEIRSSAF